MPALCGIVIDTILFIYVNKQSLFGFRVGERKIFDDTIQRRMTVISRPPDQQGFTLIELLVAMAVFAIISTAIYGGLSHMASMRGILYERYDRLAELQRVLTYMERDLLQIVARPVKSPFGDFEPALQLAHAGGIAFTRTGGDVTLHQGAQSGLLRLRYVMEEGKLVRIIQSVLDRAQDSKLYSRQLMDNLAKFQVEAFDGDEWHREWPLSDDKDSASRLALLPQMLHLSIESTDQQILRHTLILPDPGDITP
jgi:general secretion pathway protein J